MVVQQKRRISLFGPIIITIFVLFSIAGLYADWLWFDSLGYLSVFQTFIFTRILLGVAVFATFFIFLYLNFLLISKRIQIAQKRIYLLIIFLISIVAGLLSNGFWMTLLKFLNYTGFGVGDPVFQNDIAFYMFILPWYNFVISTGMMLIFAAIVFTGITYVFNTKKKKTVNLSEQPSIEQQLQAVRFEMPEKGKGHLAILGAIFLILLAAFFYLKRFSILFSGQGAVFGAGFTDVHVVLPLYSILAGVAILAAALSVVYFYVKNFRLVFGSVVLLAIVLFGGILVSSLVQKLYVEPNEFNLEEPYIERNIQHTLFAYNLKDVKTRDFPVSYDLTYADLEKNEVTIENVRLWDWRPLLPTNRQIQLFRTYYDFVDVDVDRYEIDGRIRQLMVSPRELDQRQLDQKAKTWVNEKFVFTHGYGAVVSPVNVVSGEGLPELFVQDIPPKTEYDVLRIDQPGIYFGEKTDSYVITNTKNKEFDYPLGNENVFTVYDGADGIQLSNILKKGIFAVKFGSLNLFVSSAITSESKILFNRNIKERAETLAPFLEYDSDPYMVIAEGKLMWMMDAYTTSSSFPYSESIAGINYIRNSVKVVVDAYNGDIDFYVVDENDPVIANYAKIFPDLFSKFEDMPEYLLSHIRYPEDLMRIQSRMYGTYHMKDPQVFYNKEDVWRSPTEVYASDQVELRPYYIVIKLPGEEKEGFYLITPYIPRGKENMIAWFTANSDPEKYGQLEVFELSKQELTYGPMQIEARIDQDTEISQLLTLWDQQGSEVIRGNLLVIPIEDSFIYIEPVYLKASAQGALPQLKRVIVAYEDKLTMQESLQEALDVIFKGTASRKTSTKTTNKDGTTTTVTTTTQVDIPDNVEDKFERASELYEEAQQLLQQGDFSGYAQKIEELGEILNQD